MQLPTCGDMCPSARLLPPQVASSPSRAPARVVAREVPGATAEGAAAYVSSACATRQKGTPVLARGRTGVRNRAVLRAVSDR